MPYNISQVFKVIMHIAAFDILPTDYLFGLIYKVEHTDPLSPNFDAMGFESLWLIYNLGTLFLLGMIVPLLMLSLPLFKFLSFYSEKGEKCYKLLDRWLFWNLPIRVFTESYTILIIGCMISSKSLVWTNFAYAFNSACVYLLLVILIGYPCLILYTLNRYYGQLDNKYF